MPRTRKSTKPGQSGSSGQSTQSNSKKKKVSKGRASGSRNSLLEQNSSEPKQFVVSKDKRHGSKKKINLQDGNRQNRQQQKPLLPKFTSPQQELDFIENDKKLQSLLDKVDQGGTVNTKEQQYIDTLLSRHKLLCELLDIDIDEQPDREAVTKDLQHTPDEPDGLLDQLDQDFRF